MKILITGATGFIGRELGKHLSELGNDIVVVTRNSQKAQRQLPFQAILIEGDLNLGAIKHPALKEIEAVIHLAGENVGSGRWSEVKKNAILNSRQALTSHLLESLKVSSKMKTFISASAVGYYGDTGEKLVTEISAKGGGFLAEVCESWENTVSEHQIDCRKVTFRIGVVLGPHEGALQKMILPFQLGFGGPLGSGRQWMSWIHIRDLLHLIERSLTETTFDGTYNAVAPEPVTNAKLSAVLGKLFGQKFLLPAPNFALKLALGEQAAIVLDSQRVSSRKLQELGFKFRFNDFGSALGDCLADHIEGDRIFFAEHFLPVSPAAVFDFFSDPNNLEKITPQFLNFHIVSSSTDKVTFGTVLNYRLKIHGIPVKWRTLIARWAPPYEFVDTQEKGPYAKWHHTHNFREVKGGTLMTDKVKYRVPFGKLGALSAGWYVEKDVSAIFNFRRLKIADFFKNPKLNGDYELGQSKPKTDNGRQDATRLD